MVKAPGFDPGIMSSNLITSVKGVWCNGSITVSKTVGESSNLSWPVILYDPVVQRFKAAVCKTVYMGSNPIGVLLLLLYKNTSKKKVKTGDINDLLHKKTTA